MATSQTYCGGGGNHCCGFQCLLRDERRHRSAIHGTSPRGPRRSITPKAWLSYGLAATVPGVATCPWTHSDLLCRHEHGDGNQAGSEQAAPRKKLELAQWLQTQVNDRLSDDEMMALAVEGARALDKREAAHAKRKAR